MARFVSILPLRCIDPVRHEDAMRSFVEAGVIETCRDVIPGFVSGTFLRSVDTPGEACVLVEWRDRQAFEDWMQSPARAQQSGEPVFEPPGRSALFETVHEVRRKSD